MWLILILAVIATLFAGWRAWRRLRYFLHIFQLEGYKRPEFRKWVSERRGTVLFRLSHKLAVGELVLFSVGCFLVSPYWTAAVALPAWAITFASSRLYRSDRQKKPLRYTNRMQRLLATAAVLALVPVAAGLFIWIDGGLPYVVFFLGGFFLADVLAPLWVVLAALIMKPVEAAIQEGFKRQARARLAARPDLQVVAITGSYGKTSTKFIIEEILKQRYNVLATPSSYNTPMGLCIVINEMLKPEHQVLLLEMGIRHPGDMRELCEIARPDIAVETSVGIAHLESMGSIERIAEEKGTLLEYLPPDGIAVLNVDDGHVAAMAERAPGRVWSVSVREGDGAAGVGGGMEGARRAEGEGGMAGEGGSEGARRAEGEGGIAGEAGSEGARGVEGMDGAEGARGGAEAAGGLDAAGDVSPRAKKHTAGNPPGMTAAVTATDISYGPEGASFLVRDDSGDERRFRTKLLGAHNVTNILLGVAVGRVMGLRLRQIAYAVERLEPIEHRLQLRKEGPITIIDDAFNSNPVGARNAVAILGRFDGGRRVIVTPGMIELGERQFEENRTFGQHIARHVDLAILVGAEQTRPIQEGLRSAEFPDDRMKIVDSLWDAQAFLKTYLKAGDVVLYENDLPDQYGG